jgi:hypothetical protein
MASWLIPGLAAYGQTVGIDSDDIGGVVSSARGPEAGVRVIAETPDWRLGVPRRLPL